MRAGQGNQLPFAWQSTPGARVGLVRGSWLGKTVGGGSAAVTLGTWSWVVLDASRAVVGVCVSEAHPWVKVLTAHTDEL